jgi:monoterpene epsilon-lactone hydrolase
MATDFAGGRVAPGRIDLNQHLLPLLLNRAIRLTGAKRRNRSTEKTRKHIERLSLRPARYAPSRALVRGLSVSVQRVGGAPVYTAAPAGPAPEHHVLYLHGGAYTYEISPLHWRLVRQLALSVPAEVQVPIYPLAPQATASATVPAMTELLAELVENVAPDRVTLMGDSAGGGIALAVAQQLRDRTGLQPGRIVLISPWLDVTLSEPEQPEIERRDEMLGLPGLAESGRLYAGDLDVRDPLVSPLLGELAGLAPIHVFTGTDDVLNPDARRLARTMAERGQEVHLHEAEGMQHCYALYPLIAEGKATRKTIIGIMRTAGP